MGEINGVSRADRLNGLENSKTVELQRHGGRVEERESAEEKSRRLTSAGSLI